MFSKLFGGLLLALGLTAAGGWLWAEGRGGCGKGAGCCAKPAQSTTPACCEKSAVADKKDAANKEDDSKTAPAVARGCCGKGARCCAVNADPDKKDAAAIEAEIKAARAKLSKEDQVLVEAQEYCPMMPDNRLGEMGTPLKVMVKDQPVFLCCKGCQRKALANPEATLAKVAELKAKVKESKRKK